MVQICDVESQNIVAKYFRFSQYSSELRQKTILCHETPGHNISYLVELETNERQRERPSITFVGEERTVTCNGIAS